MTPNTQPADDARAAPTLLQTISDQWTQGDIDPILMGQVRGFLARAAAPPEPASVARQEDRVLREAAKHASTLVAKGRLVASPRTDDDIRKVYKDACDHADACQQGFSYGRMQALRAVYSLGLATHSHCTDSGVITKPHP